MRILFLFTILIICIRASAGLPSSWTPDSTRRELIFLLDERKKLFDEYESSLSKKSGFFGNQTKNDLRDSRQKLEAIVAQDNKIMSALNRTLDYRNFEKQNLKYDYSNNEDRIKNLQVLNDTLNNQLQRLDKQNKEFNSKMKLNRIYLWMLVLILGIVAWWGLKKRKNSAERAQQ
jgi:hypothetical protein